MSIASHLHQLFNTETSQAYIHALRWKDRPLHAPDVRATTLVPGGRITTSLDCNATAVKRRTVNAPSMTSRAHAWTAASAPSPTGFSPPFCSVWRARRGASPGKWASMSGPAIAGAGGCAMPPCLMRCTANWRGRWKPMTSTTLPAIRGKRKGAGRSHWDASHVAGGRNASPVVAIMTRTGPP